MVSYHDIFTLPGDPLPCTNLASHKILLKYEKIINLRQLRQPKCYWGRNLQGSKWHANDEHNS